MATQAMNTGGAVAPIDSRARRSIVIASVGNILEWYDFTVYGFVAAYIARNFFVSGNENAALLASFAAFGAGFVARPLGAILFGRLADVKGRRYVLLLTMFMMAGASVLLGVLPTYAQIGILAPALVVLARLAQGLSAGAEFGGAAAYLIEWAPESRRGLFSSFHQIGTYGGLLLGSAVVAVTSSILSAEQMNAWGWRVPFILGGLLGVVAMYMRRNVEETPKFTQTEARTQTADPPAGSAMVATLQGVGIVAVWSVVTYIMLVYMSVYMQRYGGLSPQQSFWIITSGTAAGVVLIPICGALSDRFGRRPVFGLGCLNVLILPIPLYGIIASKPGFGTILMIQLAFSLSIALIAGAGPAILSELYATRQRATLVGISTAISVTIFGGFAPFIATYLIEKTGQPTAPAYYAAAVALLSFLTVLSLRETAQSRLR